MERKQVFLATASDEGLVDRVAEGFGFDLNQYRSLIPRIRQPEHANGVAYTIYRTRMATIAAGDAYLFPNHPDLFTNLRLLYPGNDDASVRRVLELFDARLLRLHYAFPDGAVGRVADLLSAYSFSEK